MKYFNLIPKIQYGPVKISNLFYKYNITETINDKFLFTYSIKSGQSLEDIAFEFYNDTELWWVVALINNINDVFFDFLLEDNLIREMARNQSTYNGILNETEFIDKYDYLSDENEKKRNIKILSPDKLNDFLSDITKLSQNDLSMETDEIEYTKLNIIDLEVFLNNNNQVIDKFGKIVTL